MNNVFEWTNPTGTKMKIEISYSEKLVDEVLNADGHEIETGKKKVMVDADLVLFANGKKVDSCWNTSFWEIIDVKDEKLNKMGLTKRIWGIKTVFTEEVAEEIEKFIADYIKANKNKKVVELENEKKEKVKEKEIENAKKIIEKAEKQKDIPTKEVARKREEAYNKMFNEGCEGYVPHIIDIDEYNRAKEIIKNNK